MARRGVFAEIQRQVRVSQQQKQRAQRAAVREHDASARRAEQARKFAERAQAQALRGASELWETSGAERKLLDREAKAAHVAAMQADVEERNTGLAVVYDEIDTVLAATLDVDDYVDLETLRRTVEHPEFDRADLETAISRPPPIPEPVEPIFAPPLPPRGLFGKKKKLAEAAATAEAAHAEAHAAWQAETASLPGRRQATLDEHATAEGARVSALKNERARYDGECAARDAEVAQHNTALDALITNLGYGTADAVQEYVSIVLANSAYPAHFEVDSDFTFDPTTAELRLRTLVPGPDKVPGIKAYKYTKTSDEITTTALSQKASKDRYAGAVHQVALRSMHEVFEADRRGLVGTISLEVGTETIHPATGQSTYIPFVAVAAERDAFIEFDLSAVVPAATLEHLGAAVSKNPHGLVEAKGSGVRRS